MQSHLLQLIAQNQLTCYYVFQKIDPGNQGNRLNPSTAGVGFYYRHVGEIMHLLCTFLGVETAVENTTMGFSDTGQGSDIAASRALVDSGYALLNRLAESHDGSWWEGEVETPFFGVVQRVKLLGHILNHNAYHAGQIRLALKHPMAN